MGRRSFWKAGVLGIGLACSGTSLLHAQSLQVTQAALAGLVKVPLNRSVVLDRDQPFADLSVADPSIVDITTTARSIHLDGKAPGRTALTLRAADGRPVAVIELQVAPDVAAFRQHLHRILPGEPIEVRTANDSIVLSGQVSGPAALDRALGLARLYAPGRVSNLMTLGDSRQVTVTLRFAEIRRSVAKNLSGSLAVEGGIGDALAGSGAAADTSLTGGSPGTMAPASLEAAALLEALEAKGVVRTLAAPELTARSGQAVTFRAGGDYPVPVVLDPQGQIAVEHQPFGLELSVTPVVLDDTLISVTIHSAVSSIDTSATQGGGLPAAAFTRHDTSTTVKMRDGESFAIVGLLPDEPPDLTGRLPWLADVPVLGRLFDSAAYQRGQSELVVILTPELQHPARGEALVLPRGLDGAPVAPEVLLFGKATGRAPVGATEAVARHDADGLSGHLIE